MVMGDNSCLKVRGLESRHLLLDGHFFTLICCKNCIVLLKGPKINEKELAHFFKNVIFFIFSNLCLELGS